MREHPLLPVDPEFGDDLYGLPRDPEGALVHILPVPFDATVSYGAGTSEGPNAVAEASVQVDLLDHDFGRPYRFGIHGREDFAGLAERSRIARELALPIIERLGDLGGDPELTAALEAVNAAGAALNAELASAVRGLLADGKIVGVLGGDHSVPFGSIQAHAEAHGEIGVLHIDAHADLREAYEGFTWSHASIMHNVLTRIPQVTKLAQIGIRDYCDEERTRIQSEGDRVRTLFDRDLKEGLFAGAPFADLVRPAIEHLPQKVYISFDIDGLDPALCPHTGTPVPGGLSFDQAAHILKALVASGREIVGFDLVEVAPGPEGDEWDANVGARLLYKLIGATLRSRVVSTRLV